MPNNNFSRDREEDAGDLEKALRELRIAGPYVHFRDREAVEGIETERHHSELR